MTYNTDRRPSFSKKKRAAFLIEHGRRCYFCGCLILDDAWDIEHLIARELLPPGGDADAPENLRPIHRHPCHNLKSKADKALIAKSNRIRRENGPAEQRKKKRPIPGRPFRQGHQSIPSRPFPTRKDRK